MRCTYGGAGVRHDDTELLPEWRGPFVHDHPLASTTLSQNGKPNAYRDVKLAVEVRERTFDTHQRYCPVLGILGVGGKVKWWSERRGNLMITSQKDGIRD